MMGYHIQRFLPLLIEILLVVIATLPMTNNIDLNAD